VVTRISLGVDFAAAACAREVCLTAAGFTPGVRVGNVLDVSVGRNLTCICACRSLELNR